MKTLLLKVLVVFVVWGAGTFTFPQNAEKDTVRQSPVYPVVLDNDTLLYIGNPLGAFTAGQRAQNAIGQLDKIAASDLFNPDSLEAININGVFVVRLGGISILAVTQEDAALLNKTQNDLAYEYVSLFKTKLKDLRARYSSRNLIEKSVFIILFLAAVILILWANRKIFPWVYRNLENLKGKLFRAVKIRGKEVLKDSSLTDFAIVVAKGIRLVITLALIYFFLVFTVTTLPWTRHWDIGPVLRGIIFTIFSSVLVIVLSRGINRVFEFFTGKVGEWKGTLIKPLLMNHCSE